MTPDEVGERLLAVLGSPPDGSYDVSYGAVTVDVAREHWLGALEAARSDDRLELAFFDWLSAVDELAEGYSVVVHLYAPTHHHHLLLRTKVPLDDARLPSATGVFAGAGWHERETWEMFGIDFEGHPDLVPLLLPDGFEGHPLRKEFVLAARVAKPWPGAKEPGEGPESAPARRPMRPPGVPDPNEWGPQAGRAEPAESGD
ncbi:MAG: hypothetical protein NVSMB13_10440 [Mycobacteriales bacterium]